MPALQAFIMDDKYPTKNATITRIREENREAWKPKYIDVSMPARTTTTPRRWTEGVRPPLTSVRGWGVVMSARSCGQGREPRARGRRRTTSRGGAGGWRQEVAPIETSRRATPPPSSEIHTSHGDRTSARDWVLRTNGAYSG